MSATAPRIAALGYHDVTDDRTASGFQRPAAWAYKIARAAFDEQLAAVAAGPPVTVAHEVDWNAGGDHLMLTFDDGGGSALYIGGALARHGWRGHFFIVTSLLGTRGFLHAAGVRELRAQGHVIGSHSHTHPDIFRDLSPAQMADEWRVSRDQLADLLGEPCTTASIPGGDISPAVLHSAALAGFDHVFTSDPDPRPGRVMSSRIIGRFVVKASHPVDRVARMARLDGWRQALLLRRLRVAAARALPGLYRRYVAARTRQP